MEPTGRSEAAIRVWLLPFAILSLGAACVFVASTAFDATAEHDLASLLRLLWYPNPDTGLNAITNAGEVVAAVLAIAITVVAIIVELAATRYTHRVTELFVREPVNFATMGFFVITALQCLMVSLTFDHTGDGSGFVPAASLRVAFGMLACCLLLLLPYFAFVFSFLNPLHIVERIRSHTTRVLSPSRWRSSKSPLVMHQEAVRGVEQLADVGLNALENKDKGVCMASVGALSGLITDYEGYRGAMGAEWFQVEGDLASNSDFVSVDRDVLRTITKQRIWFEMKVLRQYQTIYGEALNRMRDVNYVIAIDTRRIASHAASEGHWKLVDLCIKFFNTYLRATVNASDVRTAYNVLQQYRLMAQDLLQYDGGTRGIEIATHFQYYGLISFQAKLPFILETVAYDLCELLEFAYDTKNPALNALLRIFLEVDKESEGEIQEQSLRGVRKAQVKLATYFLVRDSEDLARKIFDDMEHERPERLASIRDELLGVRSAEFWEVSDRGMNFDYLTPERKQKLMEFFEWYGETLVPPRASNLPWGRSILPPTIPPGSPGALASVPPLSANPFLPDDDDSIS